MNLHTFKSSTNSEAPHFLLIGNPVGHSLSPLMHNTAARYYGMDERYHAVLLEPAELGSFAAYLNRDHLKGVNITIPYKELLFDHVDDLSPAVRRIGAMNTIQKRDGRLVAHNTDAYGFLKPLESCEEEIAGTRAIIFGTGGASKAIVYALKQAGIEEVVLVSRNPEQPDSDYPSEHVRICSYDAWPSYADEASLIVNATPLGMTPNVGSSPVGDHQKEYLEGRICYDIVYRPGKTAFLKMAKEAGARTIGGLDMLIYQGSRSFELWTGKPFPVEKIRETLKDYLEDAD